MKDRDLNIRVGRTAFDSGLCQASPAAVLGPAKSLKDFLSLKDLLALCFKENTSILTKPYHRSTCDSILEDVDDERLEKRLPCR